MSSTIEKDKLTNHNQQRSDSGSTKAPTATATSATQTFKKRRDNDDTRQEEAKRTKKRRPTKVGLNDTLRRIRHLMVEGRSNLEIQNILQLEERTFYRYMARIYQIDQALFVEQEKKTINTEIGILKDRWLKSYRWNIAMADNEKIKADIRMEAQLNAVDLAIALLELERAGPTILEQGGRELLQKLYQNSR